MLNLEYDFANIPDSICIDKDGNETTEDDPWNVKRYKNDTIPDESRTETDDPPADEDDYDEEVDEPYDYESNEVYDYQQPRTYKKIHNIDPDTCEFRVTDKNLELLDDFSWNAGEVGMTSENDPSYTITLQRKGNEIGVSVNEKSYCVVGVGGVPKAFISELRDEGEITIADDDERTYNVFPDDSYFIIYDTVNDLVLFKTQLNLEIGHVHEEILDFGFNLENIVYNVDETDTYTAVSPVIQPNDEGSTGKKLTRDDINTIINRWINLSVSKGDIVPMIVEKVNITATSWSNALAQLGTYNLSSNYWRRPLKPTDNLDSTDKQYEFFRAIAYWRAPFTKHAGQIHIETEKRQNIEYTDIYTRPDTRREKEWNSAPKTANTETSDEDIWAIYNQVCQYLKEHETPDIQIELDVANLQGHEYNNYDLHDKIYIKLPNTNELITTRVTKTTKEAHDIAKNSIEITNYKALNTVKTLTHDTLIEAENTSFTYPNSKTLRVRLVNMSPDTETDQYPSNKLLTFSLYKLENGSRSFAGKTYTKLTNSLGYAYINMKYDPGDYEIDIAFGGDELFEESETTVNINVNGVKEVQKTAQTHTNTNTNSGKTNTGKTNNGKTNNGKTNKKYKWVKVTSYYDKYGRSPNKKTILAIGKPSAGRDPSNGGFWQQEFKNKCPSCGKATLAWGIFWAGNEHNNYGRFPLTGNSEGSSAEGAVFCTNPRCDKDFSVFGYEHGYDNLRLKPISKAKKSTKHRAYLLKKGKYKYATKMKKVKIKKNANKIKRKVRAKGIAKSVKAQALSIVGEKTGYEAAKLIVEWLDKHVGYKGYDNFVDSPAKCLKRRSGNCCDITRLMFQMLDAAGCSEYYKMEYIRVWGHIYGRLTTKKTGKWRNVDCASPTAPAWGYVCIKYRNSPIMRRTTYPQLPCCY